MKDTTVDALKNLYVAMGGDIADVENITIIPDMINAIADICKTASAATTNENDEGEGNKE